MTLSHLVCTSHKFTHIYCSWHDILRECTMGWLVAMHALRQNLLRSAQANITGDTKLGAKYPDITLKLSVPQDFQFWWTILIPALPSVLFCLFHHKLDISLWSFTATHILNDCYREPSTQLSTIAVRYEDFSKPLTTCKSLFRFIHETNTSAFNEAELEVNCVSFFYSNCYSIRFRWLCNKYLDIIIHHLRRFVRNIFPWK